MTYTYFVINLSAVIFGLCALLIVRSQRIEKNIVSWFILIGIIVSAISMVVNQKLYSVLFSCFEALIAVYVTYRVYERGRL